MESIAKFLVGRLESAGVKHVMGLAGDYILNLFGELCESKKIELINCADEPGAGFAADGYARVAGIGCVAVTYSVGALKVCNPIAGAYRENSPVIIISGAPEKCDVPLHHTCGSYGYQKRVFEEITCAQAILDNPLTAGYELDRAIAALKYYRKPIYIELNRSVASQPVEYDVYIQGTPSAPYSDPHNLEDALSEVSEWIKTSKSPVILAGVQVARCQLGRDLIKFAERYNIPVACTLLSKSVVNELHPLYIGVYAGSNSSQPHIKKMVEESDCLLVLGEEITEATVGYRPSKAFQKREMVMATIDGLKVRKHFYPDVCFTDFCKGLFKKEFPKRLIPDLPIKKESLTFKALPNALTTYRFFEKINSILDENSIVIADTGDSLLGASDLTTVHKNDMFLGQAVYLSMGFAIPAALGVKLAKPKVRPIVIVGDGSFQMSMSEISTMLRWKQNPIIFVLNNRGYTTERMILEGKFNDILDWNYHLLPQLMGGGKGAKVKTEEELDIAVQEALKSDTVFVINCVVDQKDISPALNRISEMLSKKAK